MKALVAFLLFAMTTLLADRCMENVSTCCEQSCGCSSYTCDSNRSYHCGPNPCPHCECLEHDFDDPAHDEDDDDEEEDDDNIMHHHH